MNLEEVIKEMKRLGYQVFESDTKNFNLNIVGIRSKDKKVNVFNDKLVVFWYYKGCLNQVWFNVTTEPGTKALKETKIGTAILVPNQYKGVYKLDLHKGKYKALCQRLGKVQVYRDNNKDNEFNLDSTTIQDAEGINIHRATENGISVNVENWSEGCQVFADSSEFDIFINICEQSEKIWGNKFTYTLIDEI